MEQVSAVRPDLDAAGDALEAAVRVALGALERNGVPARDADEFIRECVFNAWCDWDYGVPEGDE